MPTIRSIKKGNRTALKALYDREKQNVYALALLLLEDAKDAEAAVVQIFKNIWKDVFDGKIPSDEEFAKELMHRTFIYARSRMERKATNSLRVSSNTVYALSEYDFSGEGDPLPRVLSAFSTLGRFFFVMRALKHCGKEISQESGAKIFLTNSASYSETYRTEEENFLRACETAGLDAAKLYASALCADGVPLLSAAIEEKALSTGISEILPMERRAKLQKKSILISAAALLLVALIVTSCIVIPPLFDKTYYADLTIEGYGTITMVLYDDVAPITVKNFVKLAESGFYDGLTFHRIMKGFMMQGGCPKGDGTGGFTDENGKKVEIKGEFLTNGIPNSISHVRGVVSMARGGDPYYDSASSQFFIVHEDSTFLNGSYAAFGRVLEGMDIVDAICESANPTDGNGKIKKDEQPVIESIRIRTEWTNRK